VGEICGLAGGLVGICLHWLLRSIVHLPCPKVLSSCPHAVLTSLTSNYSNKKLNEEMLLTMTKSRELLTIIRRFTFPTDLVNEGIKYKFG